MRRRWEGACVCSICSGNSLGGRGGGSICCRGGNSDSASFVRRVINLSFRQRYRSRSLLLYVFVLFYFLRA